MKKVTVLCHAQAHGKHVMAQEFAAASVHFPRDIPIVSVISIEKGKTITMHFPLVTVLSVRVEEPS